MMQVPSISGALKPHAFETQGADFHIINLETGKHYCGDLCSVCGEAPAHLIHNVYVDRQAAA